jgi:pantetheine-phosphate adenylyltransferase
MRRAIYPGTFDPLTNGHLDLIHRAMKLFDEVIVAILRNPAKTPLFTVEERVDIIRQVVSGLPIRVDTFEGLLVHYAQQVGATAIIRGIRAISDYEYEFQMALMNRRLDPTIETIFMMPAEPYTFVSSRLVKEVCALGGDICGLVPPLVEQRVKQKVNERVAR